jgi:hypothetical protein
LMHCVDPCERVGWLPAAVCAKGRARRCIW